MKSKLLLVFLPFLVTPIISVVAEENQKLFLDAPQIFSINIPEDWDVEKNTLFYESGWIASLYDDVTDWNVQIDISQQSINFELENTNTQTIVENLFVSYYNICQNDTFDRKFFEDLPLDWHSLLNQQYAKQLTDGITETKNISEWWSELTDSEIHIILKDLQIENSDYLTGDMCSDFIPIDYQIIEHPDFIRYQIFYSWKQTFSDDTYFDNYGQVNQLGIKGQSKTYVINISSLSTVNQFEMHNESVEQIIDSIEFLEQKPSLSTQIQVESRINMGWWANDQSPDSDFEDELELLIDSKIIQRPSIMTNFDEIEITFVPKWLKNPTNFWYEQELSDMEYVQLISNLLERGIIEFEIISK